MGVHIDHKKTYYVEPPAFEETRFCEGLGEVWVEVSGLLDRTIPHCMNTSTAVVSLARYVHFFSSQMLSDFVQEQL